MGKPFTEESNTMDKLRKILSIFARLILFLTVILVTKLAVRMIRVEYFYTRYEPHTYKHAMLLLGRHNTIFYGDRPYLDSATVSSSLSQSIKDGRFLKRYTIISVESDSTELIPLHKFSDVFAEKLIRYNWLNDTFIEDKEKTLIVLCFDENNAFLNHLISRSLYSLDFFWKEKIMGHPENCIVFRKDYDEGVKDTIKLTTNLDIERHNAKGDTYTKYVYSHINLVADNDFDPEQYLKEGK